MSCLHPQEMDPRPPEKKKTFFLRFAVGSKPAPTSRGTGFSCVQLPNLMGPDATHQGTQGLGSGDSLIRPSFFGGYRVCYMFAPL